jgi:polysaccharide biosynthesis protein PslG
LGVASSTLKAALRRALLLALAVLLLAPAGALADQLHGAQLHSLWSGSSADTYERELDMLRDSGADALRLDISWSSLETEGKGRFSPWYVQKTDHFLEEASERNLKVIVSFWSTPCWASSAPEDRKQGCTGQWWNREVDRWAPTNANDYADAAAWAAQRWGSKIAAIEIWNEPNLPDQYSLRAPDPAVAYADILKTAYPRVKQAAPDLPVLGGSLAFADGTFLERLYDLGIKGHFDAIAMHPYNEWRDPDDLWKPEWRKYTFRTGVPWVREIMVRHGDADKDIWLTEFGFSTCGTGDRWCVTQEQQAEYTKDSFRIARGWDYVRAAIAYNLRNKGTGATDREGQFGLIHRDFSPKPAYQAFQEAMAGYGDSPEPTPEPEPRPEPVQVEAVAVTPGGGGVDVSVTCPAGGPTCAGTVTVETPTAKRKGKPRKGRKGKRRSKRPRRVKLGSRRYRVLAGETRLYRVRVSGRHRTRLARRNRVQLRTTAVDGSSEPRAGSSRSTTLPGPRRLRSRRG